MASHSTATSAAHESVPLAALVNHRERPQRVLVTGNPLFLYRHLQLFDALAQHFPELDRLSEPLFSAPRRAIHKARSVLYERGAAALLAFIERFVPLTVWDKRVFVSRSRHTEERIAQLARTPDLVIHVFGMHCPFWEHHDIPYCTILDYTASLAKRNFPDWTPFVTDRAWQNWLECERRAYNNAFHLFPFGEQTKRSLISDYGVDPTKITVIGSSGHFAEPFSGDRTFGSKRILFYSSDAPGMEFYRKGGDIVIAAFRIVRQQLPDAKVAFVGKVPGPSEPGFENHGYVSADKMRELFLSSDLVVAPSRCDPFPGFLIEAMNYGVPCVASAADGMPEIVDHNVTGLVIPEPTAERVATEVVELLGNPDKLQLMSESARRKVRNKLNWASIAGNMAQVIHTSFIFKSEEPLPI